MVVTLVASVSSLDRLVVHGIEQSDDAAFYFESVRDGDVAIEHSPNRLRDDGLPVSRRAETNIECPALIAGPS